MLIKRWQGLTPPRLRRGMHQLRRHLERRRTRRLSTEEVFTLIYRDHLWGRADGDDEFCSGSGSTNDGITAAYAARIGELAAERGFHGKVFVDLGCGDFRVGARLREHGSHYIGIDVVRPLVERNMRRFGRPDTEFKHGDIVADPLPAGDVCFVRQVFQHLSNAQIQQVLAKLAVYRWVFITEHVPACGVAVHPNRDKPPGSDIRLYENSGVFLSEPPFAIAPGQLEVVLECAGTDLGDGRDPGMIQTLLYLPRQGVSS